MGVSLKHDVGTLQGKGFQGLRGSSCQNIWSPLWSEQDLVENPGQVLLGKIS
mgnify:CR=1